MTLLVCAPLSWGCNFEGMPSDADETCGGVTPSEFTGDTYNYTLTFDMREGGESWTVTGTMSFARESQREPTGQVAVIGRGRTWANYSYDVQFSESIYTSGDVTFTGDSIFENVSSSTFGSSLDVTCNLKRGYEETNLSALYINPPTNLDARQSPFSAEDEELRGACDSEPFGADATGIQMSCRATPDDSEVGVTFSNELTNIELSLELATPN